jgi:hypothetical protein
MNTSLVRYVLDPTGTNPDNLVVGEPHTLSDLRNRVIAPVFGAFFTEGCSVVDTDNNNRVLIRGIDYVFAELYQSLTLKFGKEVCGLIIVINRDVGSHVKVTYQAVGSQYVTSAEGLKNLLEELLEQDFPAYIVEGDRLYRVRVGNYITLEDAARMEQMLKRAGYPTVIVST